MRRRSEISIGLPSSVAPAICPNPTTKADFNGIAAPSYPPEAIRRGIQGDVLVRLLVSDTGKVERVKVVQSSGHAILDNLVVAWLSDWHGKPARMHREPVWTYYKQRVRFRLN